MSAADRQAIFTSGCTCPAIRSSAVTVRIPAGTPNGRTFRVRGKGVRRADGTQGDLLVKVDVQVPTQLTDTARDALEKFKEASAGEDPRDELLRKGRT